MTVVLGETVVLVAGVWLLTFVLAMPPLIGWSTYAFRQSQSFCFADWREDKSYAFFMICVCFGGPCSVMIFSYVNILREVRQSKKRVQGRGSKPQRGKKKGIKEDLDGSVQGYLPTSNSSQTDSTPYKVNSTLARQSYDNPRNQPGSDTDQALQISDVDIDTKQPTTLTTPATDLAAKRQEKQRKDELRLTLSFLVVIVTFVICWLPFCITMFTYMYLPSSSKDNTVGVNRVVDMCTLLLGCLNSSCNPIIYGVMNRNFRAAYKRLFCHSCAFWGGTGRSTPGTTANSGTGSNTH